MFSSLYLYLVLLAIIIVTSQRETYSKEVAFKSSSLSVSADLSTTCHLLLHRKSSAKTHFPKTETNKNHTYWSLPLIQIWILKMVPTYPHYWRKRSLVNPQALLPLMILCFFFILHCDASRASSPSSVFYTNPNNDHNKNTMRRGHFLGFLPRHFPVPASGPSRKHNDIGLQALLSPWSRSVFLFLPRVLYII